MNTSHIQQKFVRKTNDENADNDDNLNNQDSLNNRDNRDNIDNRDNLNNQDEISQLKNAFESKSVKEIKEYIMEKFTKKNGPQKSVSFYKAIVQFYKIYPETASKIINSIPEWGYWKDYNFLILYGNQEMKDYVYQLWIDQLISDFNSYDNLQQISMLAKWIPRYGKSFDKKTGCVKQFCAKFYPEKETVKALIQYRRDIAMLNKYLGTTEIYLCSKEYEKIDFDTMPKRCLYRNMKTFLKVPELNSKLQQYFYKQYVKLDLKGFIDYLVFKKTNKLEKDILKEVWNINKYDYCDQIYNLIGQNIKTCDVMIDTSKRMYDEKLISISFGIALLASFYKNKVYINAYEPYCIDFEKSFDLFKNINLISQECAYFEKMNIKEMIKNDDLKKSTLLVVTNKLIARDEIKELPKKKKIIYWYVSVDEKELTEIEVTNKFTFVEGNFYNARVIKKEKEKKSKDNINNIIEKSDEIYEATRDYTPFILKSTFAVLGISVGLAMFAINYS
jgi:hypothetical protein